MIYLFGFGYLLCCIVSWFLTKSYFETEFPSLPQTRGDYAGYVLMSIFGPVSLLVALLHKQSQWFRSFWSKEI